MNAALPLSQQSAAALGRAPISNELATLLCRAVHPRFGIIRELVEFPSPHDLPRFYTYMAPLTDTALSRKGYVPHYPRQYKGGSLECSYESALWATVCEGLERYSAAIYDEGTLISAPGALLGAPAALTQDLIYFDLQTYRKKNFPCQSYDPSAERTWVEGVDVGSGERVLLPAQVVYFDYVSRRRSDYIIPCTSSGLAAGATMEAAVLSALCEVLERDAFMCHWLLKKSPPRALAADFVDATFPDQLRTLVNDENLDVSLYDLTLDHGASAILASIYSPVLGAISFGASCKLDLRTAVQKAVQEAVHSWLFIQNLRTSNAKKIRPDEIKTFLDHAAYYAYPETHGKLSFLTESKTEWNTKDSNQPNDLRSLVAHLKQRGYRVLAFDITAPDVQSLGIKVARVIVPGLHPLYCGKLIVDGPARLRRVHAEFMPGEPYAFNRDIHPFP